ncbi:MAG: DMT family transporter [bacterium]
MNTYYFLGHLTQILSINLWTGAIVVTKIITVDISPFIIVPLQMLFGTMLLFSYFIILRKSINLNSFYSGVIFGLIAPGMAFSFFMFASTKTDALSMIVFWSLLPLLTPIFGRIFLSESISPFLYFGLLIAVIGSYILISNRSLSGTSNLFGNLLAFCGVLCSITGHIIGRKFNKKHLKPEEMALGQVFGATITSTILLIINIFIFDLKMLNVSKIYYLTTMPVFIYLVVFATALNFLLYNFALSRIPVAWVSFYSIFIPPLGVVFSYFILNEIITKFDFYAIIIIFIGSIIPLLNKYITNIKVWKKI